MLEQVLIHALERHLHPLGVGDDDIFFAGHFRALGGRSADGGFLLDGCDGFDFFDVLKPFRPACGARTLDALHQRLRAGPLGMGDEERLLVDFPRGRQTAPVGEVAVPVDEALEYLIDDGPARRVGVEDGVQYLGVADGAGDELAEALVTASLGLVGERRHPEVGLEQRGRDEDGEQQQDAPDQHRWSSARADGGAGLARFISFPGRRVSKVAYSSARALRARWSRPHWRYANRCR